MHGLLTARPLLIGSALAAAIGAVIFDAAPGEHPTHVLVLVAVTAVMSALGRRLVGDAKTTIRIVVSAISAQPVLHLGAGVLHPDSGPHHHSHTLLHALTHEVATATLQIAVPALVVAALAVVARLVWLVTQAIRRPLAPMPMLPIPVRPALLRLGLAPQGAMLHWCGWTIVAGRRGPPLISAHAVL